MVYKKAGTASSAHDRGGASVGLVYSWWLYVNYEGEIFRKPARPRFEGDVYEAHVHQNFIGNASVPLIRQSVLEEVGLYDTSFRARNAEGCEDWDLTLRIANQYAFGLVPDHLSAYRRAENPQLEEGASMSDNTEAMERSYRRLIEKIKEQRPDISEEVLHWSRANFYDYLATKSYENGNFSKALHWLSKLIRIDPQSLLSSWVRRTTLKAAIRTFVHPLSSALWDDPRKWRRFKAWVRNPYNQVRAQREDRLTSSAELKTSSEQGDKSSKADLA